MPKTIDYLTTNDIHIVWQWVGENHLHSKELCGQGITLSASILMFLDSNTENQFYRIQLYYRTKMHSMYAIKCSEKQAYYLYKKNAYVLKKYAEKYLRSPLLYRESITKKIEPIWEN